MVYQQKTQSQLGFTLVELSIVLVIIALITAVIASGVSFVKTATYRKQITQLSMLQGAVQTFTSKYACYPGDCADPTVINGYTYTGDGNGFLPTTWNGNENKGFWIHLNASKILPDALYSNSGLAGVLSPRAAMNESARLNAYGNIGYSQNVVEIDKTDVSGAFLTAEINFIDRKMDDGVAASGYIRTSGYGTGATTVYGSNPCFPLSTSCNSGATQCVSGGAYSMSLSGASDQCNLVFVLGNN